MVSVYSCHVEKRQHLPGFYVESYSGQAVQLKRNATNVAEAPNVASNADEMPNTSAIATSDTMSGGETSSVHGDPPGAISFKPSLSIEDLNKSSEKDTTVKVRTTSQIAGISSLTGATFGANQWALDMTIQSIANATGTSLRLMPAVSVFGLSTLGMLLLTSGLVALGVFIFLMIQRRKTMRKRKA
jgi:hypothetical protein